MAFPTIPTVAAGRVLSVLSTDTSGGTVTSPDLSSLTKNAGDLLIAICIVYDGNSTNAEFSSWGGSFTEFVDQATTATMGIGCAYKWSTGSETGTFTVAVAGGAAASDAAFFLLSIPGAHATTPPEGGTIANGTTAAADPPAGLNPAGWDAEDTLWIAVGGSGETGTGGSFTGIASAPANYTDYADSGISADAVGGVEGAVAFRQLNAASEDVGAYSVDVSNARNSALLLAVRPALENPTATGAISVSSATVAGTGSLILTATGAVTVPAATVAGSGAQGFTATGAITVPAATVEGAGAEVFTAAGAVAVPAATVAGVGDHTAGAEEPTGTGAIAVPSPTVAGVGELIFTATGAIAVPAAATAGLGSEVFTGSGAIAALPATVNGIGAEVFIGSGSIQAPPATVSGTGDHSEGTPNPAGSGAISAQAPTVAGVGEIVLIGTGAFIIPDPTVNGAGLHFQNVTGTGSIVVPAALVSGSGSGGETTTLPTLILGSIEPIYVVIGETTSVLAVGGTITPI